MTNLTIMIKTLQASNDPDLLKAAKLISKVLQKQLKGAK